MGLICYTPNLTDTNGYYYFMLNNLFHTYNLDKSFLMQTYMLTLEHTQMYTNVDISLDSTNSEKRNSTSFYKTCFKANKVDFKRN